MSLADRTERVRLLELGVKPKTIERLYLAEQGIRIVTVPILPTGVMV